MTFDKGANVGPYRILEQLGQGGMATVYKAYHAALDRYVAIKVLHMAFREDAKFLARFQREARVVARLEHAKIVPIYDYSEHGGQPYLVMKFIEGDTLKARLKQGPLTKAEALEIIGAVGDALSYAHGNGVLHRDIKPSNILLATDGSIYLADFGLARIAQAGESTLTQEMLIGTPQYISPEQAKGESHLAEGTDIYSFGVLMYELVVGRVPFNADTPFSIVHDHIYAPLPLPRILNPRVPQPVERVLLRALAKTPKDRFESVDEMVEAFSEAVQGRLPVSVRETAAPGREVALAEAGEDALSSGDAGAIDPEAAVSGPGKSGQEETNKRHRAKRARIDSEKGQRTARQVTPWWGISGLVLSLVCLFLFVLVLGQAMNDGNTGAGGSGLRTATSPISSPAAANGSGSGLETAGDHWERAQALIVQGEHELALEEILIATRMVMQIGGYMEAANMLASSMATLEGPYARDPRLTQALTEALFLGAPSRGMLDRLESLEQGRPGWLLLPPLKARAVLFAGDVGGARDLLDETSSATKEEPITQAIEAEILIAEKEIDKARTIINDLLDQQKSPRWLFDHLKDLSISLGEKT